MMVFALIVVLGLAVLALHLYGKNRNAQAEKESEQEDAGLAILHPETQVLAVPQEGTLSLRTDTVMMHAVKPDQRPW